MKYQNPISNFERSDGRMDAPVEGQKSPKQFSKLGA